ncbi:MAG: hypothetical protein ACR2HG_04320 [Pyrinomonadaceae bacterium]
MENRIDAALSAADRDSALNAVAQIRTLLPFLIDLSPEERQALPKMGDKSRAFVQQALQLAEHDDSYLPRSFDVAEMKRDVELADALYPIMVALKQLSEFVDDTYVQVGSEAYTAALVVYQSAKRNGQGAALDDLLDALGQRFARKSKDAPPTT